MDHQVMLKELAQNLQSGPTWGTQHINGPFPIVSHMITFLFTWKQLTLQKLFQQEQALPVVCLSDNYVELFSPLSNLLVN